MPELPKEVREAAEAKLALLRELLAKHPSHGFTEELHDLLRETFAPMLARGWTEERRFVAGRDGDGYAILETRAVLVLPLKEVP